MELAWNGGDGVGGLGHPLPPRLVSAADKGQQKRPPSVEAVAVFRTSLCRLSCRSEQTQSQTLFSRSRSHADKCHHTLQTVPDCSKAEVHVSPSMPTQAAAAWGYVLTPLRLLQAGCWKYPWMSLIWLPEGV